MIIGALSIISLFGLIAIAFWKIYNLSHAGEKKPLLFALLEFGLAAFLFLFLFLGVQVNGYSAAKNPVFLPDALESAQYLQLGTYLLLAVFFLMFFEIIVSLGMIGMRGRMEPSKK